MRIAVPFLLLACLSTSALASGGHDSVKMQYPVQHIVLAVSRRAASVGMVGHGEVEFRLESLMSRGRSLHLTPGAPRSSNGRIVQTLGHGVEAWYINTPFGIEQGFVLSRSPGGDDASIMLALGGTLLPYRHGSDLRFSAFLDPKRALSYSRFIAYDADHRRLPARMALAGKKLTLSVDARGARYPLTLDPLLSTDPVLLTTSEGVAPHQIATSGDGSVVAVGAPEAHTAGVVYVFTKSGTKWGNVVTLPNPDTVHQTQFGFSVGISADGKTVLVAAPALSTITPEVYVFARSGATWTQAAALSTAGVAAPGELDTSKFGFVAALSADGQTALVGAPDANTGAGAAYAYKLSGATWSAPVALPITSISNNAGAGATVALSSDGNTAIVGAPQDRTGAGALYAFSYVGGNWSAPVLLPSPATNASLLGLDSAISGDGKVILVEANRSVFPNAGVYAYELVSGSWMGPILIANVVPSGVDSRALALSLDGTRAVVGSPGGATGSAYVLTRDGATWNDPTALSQIGQGNNTNLGFSAALTPDGHTAFVGAVGTNPVFVYSSPVDASFSTTPSQIAGPVLPGSPITFQFAIGNADTDIDATGLVLDEVLPVGASYVSSNAGSGSCHYTSASNSVTCTLASLATGSTGANAWRPSITIKTSSTGGAQINTAGLSADQILDGVATAKDTFYNDVPPVASDGSLTATSGQAMAGTLHASVAYPFPGQTLTYSLVAKPAHGTLTLDAASGAYHYTSSMGFSGSDEFTFDVGDGLVNSNTGTVTITVNASGSGGGGSFDLIGILILLATVYRRRENRIHR
jgi:Bacterial Ig domain